MNASIDLSSLKPLTGSIIPAIDGIVVRPERDGAFSLSLEKDESTTPWTKDRYLVMDFEADMDRMADVYFDFVEGEGPQESILSVRYLMIPSRRVKMAVALSELDSHRFFLPTYPGTLKGHVLGRPTSIERIGEIRIRLSPNDTCRSFRIRALYLASELPPMQVEGKPMVDPLGQRRGYDWPGKMGSQEELIEYLRAERKKAGASSGFPEGWSRYGGWKKLHLGGTGFFRVHHDGRRWWLVDPDGYAFYSNGLCYGARTGVHGFVDGMEGLFEWLPDPSDPTWADCWTEASAIPEFAKRNGVESGKGRRLFNFPRANMIRAFGPEEWRAAWTEINAGRMRRWGINTIGVGVNTYEDERTDAFLDAAKIPFVVTLKNFPLTGTCIYRDFPDVFSPEYAEGAQRFAREQLSRYVGNPYLIGYFITNEPEWLFQESVNPAERILAYDGPLHSKDALIDFLSKRYGGDVAALNRAWGLDLSDFDGLRAPRAGADGLSSQAKADLDSFRDLLIRKYCAVPSEALREVDGDHLNLGMRYHKLTANEFAGNGAFDICSFNCYRIDPVPMFDIAAQKDTRPGLIGEWHVAGSDDRALATGLVHAPNQDERVKACLYFMERAMAHPNSVGAHYFEMNDQPVLGRFDGECMQHGLISLCNVPYPELDLALEDLARRMYDIVSGSVNPTAERGITAGSPY